MGLPTAWNGLESGYLRLGGLVLFEGFDVSHGRLAEEAAVLSAELADAFVANFVGSAGCVEAIQQHALACRLEAELFLVLQRAHGGEIAELVVEGGDAHPGGGGKFFHVQWPGKVCSKP